MKKYVILILILSSSVKSFSQNSRFDSLYHNLIKIWSKDKEKIEYLDFFKFNIGKHYTQDYVWVDSLNRIIKFDELNYPTFNDAVSKFDSLKLKTGKLKAIPRIIPDSVIIDMYTIKNSIENLEGYKKRYSKNTVSEFLLPYRTLSEPLYNWRDIYRSKFVVFKSDKDIRTTIKNIVENIDLWFVCTYGIEEKTEPQPFLGSLQLLQRKKGGCEDAANLMTFALRSLGIPCAIDIIPFWGTSTGGHVLNTAFDSFDKPVHFDALIKSDSLYEMIREPSKIFRVTYSNNPQALVNIISPEKIPNYGLLRSANYIDVTNEYVRTKEIRFDISDTLNSDIVYASVFNGGKWRPVWYCLEKGKANFKNMVPGVVYLPQIYLSGKLLSVGNPKLITNDTIITFKPQNEVHSVKLTEMPGYLKFKTDKIYTLYYYDLKWKRIQRKMLNDGTKSLIFHNVPIGALLLLKPEDSKGKERPFYIDEKDIRYWL